MAPPSALRNGGQRNHLFQPWNLELARRHRKMAPVPEFRDRRYENLAGAPRQAT
jgi:hypothetical protein